MVLSKSAGDSTLSVLQSEYVFEELDKMLMMEAAMLGAQITQIHQLTANKVLVSGSNIPTTAIEMK